MARGGDVSEAGAMGKTGPREDVRKLFARVAQRCDLPPPPTVAMRALTLLRDGNVHADEISRVIRADPALTSRAFRIAASPLFMRRTAPTNFSDVLSVLGVDRLREVITAAAVRTLYRGSERVVERLWEHALATALAAQDLTRELDGAGGAPAAGRAFMAGLFHDVGKLIFHLANRVATAELRDGDSEAERALFGATHPEVGAALADLWGLEGTVVQAIAGHHTATAGGLARTLGAADGIAYSIGHGAGDGPTHAVPDVGVDLAAVGERVSKAFASERGFFG